MMLRLCLGLLLLALPNGLDAKMMTPDPAVAHANSILKDGIAYKEGYYGSGNNRLHYVEAGKGPLVIFYHGFPSFWYSYFDQMEALKTRYRVVAVDGLGAGLSAKPLAANAYQVETLAAQIDGLARRLNGDRRFTLVGHDWGAALAFAYAQAYPERLNAVVGISAPPYNQFLQLVGSNAEQQSRSQYMQLFRVLTLADLSKPGATERIWQQAYGGLIAKGELSPAEAELFRQALASPRAINGGMNWYRANIPPFDKITTDDYWPKHNARITVPALLLWGEADKTFVDDFLRNAPQYADNLKIVTLPQVDHWATMEKPELATKAIDDFLRTIPKRPKRNRN